MRGWPFVVVAVAALFVDAAVATADDARVSPPAGRQVVTLQVDGHTIPVVVLVPEGRS